MSKVAKVKFKDYQQSIPAALDAIGAADRLPHTQKAVIMNCSVVFGKVRIYAL